MMMVEKVMLELPSSLPPLPFAPGLSGKLPSCISYTIQCPALQMHKKYVSICADLPLAVTNQSQSVSQFV